MSSCTRCHMPLSASSSNASGLCAACEKERVDRKAAAAAMQIDAAESMHAAAAPAAAASPAAPSARDARANKRQRLATVDAPAAAAQPAAAVQPAVAMDIDMQAAAAAGDGVLLPALPAAAFEPSDFMLPLDYLPEKHRKEAAAAAERDARAAVYLQRRLTGIFGHACFRQLVNNFSRGRFVCINTMEACRVDCWIAEKQSALLTDRVKGVMVQVKSTLASTNRWETNIKGSKTRLSVPWPGYDSMLLSRVSLANGNYVLMKAAWEKQEPLLELASAQHSENVYVNMPFSRSSDPFCEYIWKPREGEFAATLKPGMATGYKVPSPSHTERTNRVNSWRVAQDDDEVLTDESLTQQVEAFLDAVWADRFHQLDRKTFVECERLCSKDNAKEHHSVKLMQLLLQAMLGTTMQVCQPDVGPDALVMGCPLEWKCAVHNSGMEWLGTLKPKDKANLKSGRVRMLISTRLHWNPEDFKESEENFDIYVIPWLAVIDQERALKEFGYKDAYIDIDGVISEAACAPFRMSLLQVDQSDPTHTPSKLRKLLHQCMGDLTVNFTHFLHPHWVTLTTPEYVYDSAGLPLVEHDLSRVHLTGAVIKAAIGKGWTDLSEHLDERSTYLEEWPYKTVEVKDDEVIEHQWVMSLRDSDAVKAFNASKALAGGWPKNPHAPCPVILGRAIDASKGETVMEGQPERHRHTANPSLMACLRAHKNDAQFTGRPSLQHKYAGRTTDAWYAYADGVYEEDDAESDDESEADSDAS